MNRIAVLFGHYHPTLPLMLIGLSTTGRGVSNSLLFMYALWGLISLRKINLQSRGIIVAVWLSMFFFSVFSTAYNGAMDLGKKQLMVYFLSSLALVFTLGNSSNLKLLLGDNRLLWLMSLPLIFYVGRLLYFYQSGHFDPAHQMSGMDVAILLPLYTIFFFNLFKDKWQLALLLVGICTLVLLMIGNSRTELLMLLASLAVVFAFVHRKLLLLTALPFLSVLVILIFFVVHDRQYSDYDGNIEAFLDKVGSGRMTIWNRALSNPPENQLLGSGVNNTMAFLPDNNKKDGLHSAYIEIWYETGYLGLGLWLLLFIMLLKNLPRTYRIAEGWHRILYAAFLGSFTAVLVAGLLDKGYGSIYFEFFIFYLGAMLYLLGQEGVEKEF